MNQSYFMAAVMILFLAQSQAFSQSEELLKFEVAAEFSTFQRESFESRTEIGVGARFTYNLNRVLSFETAGYFFPQRCFRCPNNGRVTEVFGGVKAGKRFENWGIFAKARPGVVSFSQGEFNIIQAPSTPAFPFAFDIKRLTSFATDVGGVLEFYPSKRIVTRFDAGDTIIHFTRRTTNVAVFDPLTEGFTLVPITRPARTIHHFQFMASVGFRF